MGEKRAFVVYGSRVYRGGNTYSWALQWESTFVFSWYDNLICGVAVFCHWTCSSVYICNPFIKHIYTGIKYITLYNIIYVCGIEGIFFYWGLRKRTLAREMQHLLLKQNDVGGRNSSVALKKNYLCWQGIITPISGELTHVNICPFHGKKCSSNK